MSAKYEILKGDTVRIADGTQLYRIRALRRIETAFGPVEPGVLGGYVSSEANLSQEGECWLGHRAKAYGDARVEDNAFAGDIATVKEGARLYGDAVVSERSQVFGGAAVGGKARVFGDARLGGHCRVCTSEGDTETTRISGHCVVGDYAHIGYATSMKGAVFIGGRASVEGAVLDGSAFALLGRVKTAMQLLLVGPWVGTKPCGTFTASLDRNSSAVSIRGCYFEEGSGAFDTLDAFVDDYIKRFGIKRFLKGEAFQYVALMRSMLRLDEIPM